MRFCLHGAVQRADNGYAPRHAGLVIKPRAVRLAAASAPASNWPAPPYGGNHRFCRFPARAVYRCAPAPFRPKNSRNYIYFRVLSTSSGVLCKYAAGNIAPCFVPYCYKRRRYSIAYALAVRYHLRVVPQNSICSAAYCHAQKTDLNFCRHPFSLSRRRRLSNTVLVKLF